MSFVSLKLFAGDGTTNLGELPSFKTVAPMQVLNDVGAFTLDYPIKGIRASELDSSLEREIAVMVDGTERARYLVEEDGRDEIKVAKDNAVLSISGREVSQLLDYAKVYPVNGPGTLPAIHPFVNATPGNVLITLINKAQQRGAIPGWNYSFNATVDSNGQAWGSTVTFDYKVNATVLDVLKHLSNTLGLIDWRVSGRTIHAYKIDTFMRQNKVAAVFSPGRDIQKMDRNRSRRELATVVLVEGDDGKTVERVDATAVALRGRKEGYFSQSGVADAGTLNVIGDLQLSFRSSIKEARPVTVNFDASTVTPKPYTGFNIGDDVYLRIDNALVKQRVMRMSLTMNTNGFLVGDLDLNDIFEDREIVADRMIKGALGGIGTGGPTVTTPPFVEDQTTPGKVAQPGATSSVYVDGNNNFSQVTVTWPALTVNTDGSVFDDLDYYEVQYSYDSPDIGAYWRDGGTTRDTVKYLSALLPGRNLQIRVRAVDRAKHEGEWSDVRTIVTKADDVAPESPSTPVVENFMGLLMVTDTGGTASGAPRAADELYREIHISTINNFIPDFSANSTTLAGKISTPGPSYFEKPAGVTQYVKVVAYDSSGNRSNPSFQNSASTSKVVSDDILDGAVGTLKLADLAVVNAKLGNLAVNDAKIGNVAAGKITAGILTSQLTISGRIATALSGARREMNSIGFQAYNASEQLTINLNGVDNLLTGWLRTAINGRRVELGSAGSIGEIRLYAPDNNYSFLRSYTAGDGREGLQLGSTINGAQEIWNSIFYNQQEWASYHTKIHDFVFQDRWSVIQTADRGNVLGTYRMNMNPGSWQLRAGPSTDVSRYVTYDFLNGHMKINFFTDANIRFEANVLTDTSPAFVLAAPNGFGGVIQVKTDNRGTLFELNNIFNSGFIGVRAGAFELNSDERGKAEIADFSIPDPIAEIEKFRPRKFRRKGAGDRPVLDETGNLVAVIEALGPEEFGVVAQEVSEYVRTGNVQQGFSVDFARWLLLLTIVIQRLIADNKKGKNK